MSLEKNHGDLMPFDWRAKAISGPAGPAPTPSELHPADRPSVTDQPRTLSAPRAEDAANRIARWFTAEPRGGVRAAEVADHLHIPLAQLTTPSMYERLERRGVLVLKVPGVRYVFFYLASGGVPDGVALRRRWSVAETLDLASAGRAATIARYDTQQSVERIVAFLAKNPGRAFAYQQLSDALGGAIVSSTTMKSEKFLDRLRAMGVTVVYAPDRRGPKGSRSYVMGAES